MTVWYLIRLVLLGGFFAGWESNVTFADLDNMMEIMILVASAGFGGA